MSRPRLAATAAALLLVSGFAAANAHLVTVALGSQPGCVLDTSTDKEGAAHHRAAKPSC